MAKKRASAKNKEPVTFKRVHGDLVPIESGGFNVYCPECSQEPVIKTVDYDCTSDSKYVWFIHSCPRCSLHIVSFSNIGGGKVDISHLYDVYGRNLEDKANKKLEKEVPVKVLKKKKILPKPLGKRKFIIDLE